MIRRKNLSLLLSILFSLLCVLTGHAQQPELVMQAGHNEGVQVVGFIQGGKALITKGEGTPGAAIDVKVWEVATGRLLLTIPAMNPVALSPDSKTLATAATDRTIRVWDLATGRRLAVLRAGFRESSPDIESIAFSSDGHSLASLNTEQGSTGERRRKWIQTWQIATGEKKIVPISGESEVSALAFTADNRVVPVEGVVSSDGKVVAHSITNIGEKSLDTADWFVELREVSTGQVLQVIKASTLDDELRFTADSKILSTSSHDSVELWDVGTGAKLLTIKASFDVYESRFSPDGKLLALGGDQRAKTKGQNQATIEIFDVASGNLLQTFKGPERAGDSFSSLLFSPDSKMIAGGRTDFPDCTSTLWDLATGQEVRSFSGVRNVGDSVSFSPDDRSLLIPNGQLGNDAHPAFTIWSLVSGGEPRTIAGEFLSFSPDGRRLLMKSQVPSTESEKARARETTGFGEDFFKLKVLDVDSGTELRLLENRFSTRDILELSPDGRVLASWSCCVTDQEKVTINLWNVVSGKLIRSIDGFSAKINFVLFSPDSATTIIAVDQEKTTRLWSVASGRLIRQFVFDVAPSEIEFSPDGKKLAGISGSHTDPDWNGEMTIRVWSLPGGNLLYTRKLSIPSLNASIAFSPDSKLLAGSSLNVDVWDANTGKALHTFEVDRSGAADSGTSAYFSPDSRLLVSLFGYTNGSRIQLWNVETGAELSLFKNQSEDAQSGGFDRDGKRFVTLGRDGIIKLWDLSSGELIASLAALDHNDWLVVSPDGRFDGTPAAWNKILWRFKESILNVAPVEIFFNEFYSPDLLADVISGKRSLATRKIEQLDRRQPQLRLARADGPSEPGAASVRNVTLQIEATEASQDEQHKAGSGVQDVRLFRNGSLVKLWRGDAYKLDEKDGCTQQGDRKVTCAVTVPIVAGVNNFTAYAFNHDNVKSIDASLVINGADSLKRQGVAYVLAVGVNSYSNTKYDLKYAVPDAVDFAAEIKRQQETLKTYTHVEVVPLYDKDATKANILQALSRLAEKAQPEDAVIVYFSGHGAAAQQRFYLIPYDLGYQGPRTKLSATDLQTILEHSISDKELETAVEKIDAGQLLMVIDACNSGQALDSEEKRRGPMNSKGLAQLAYEKGMYILTAAQSYQAAWEASKLGHGYLTYALIEQGLKQGAADEEPKDGAIVLREWLNYATEQVPRMQEEKMKKTPGIKDRQGRSLELVFVEGDENIKDPAKRNVQRPRVFYRREPDVRPLVVANVATAR
jgi:WD40 repeat protein